ncbi:MAG: hypothetical protein J5586_06225 [Clostridia bacterium]|nr:hypothetical protein [Clostridia bacterium]
MEHIKRLADVNTVIGAPITADGDTLILPVSKVSLGMLVGGGEYIGVAAGRKTAVDITCDGNYPFIGASTVGMALTPLAFVAVQDGNVRVLPAKQDCPSDRLMDLMPQIMETAERLITELCGTDKNGEGKCGCGTKKRGRSGDYISIDLKDRGERTEDPDCGECD